MIRLQSIHRKTFEKYGTVIEFPESEREFEIIVSDRENPWRLAIYRYGNKAIHFTESHPASMESFEPLEGVSVLVVAEHDSPERCEAFLLDKPVCLHKGIWHQVLSLTDEAQVKITENFEVASEYYRLERPVAVTLSEAEGEPEPEDMALIRFVNGR